MTSDPAGWLRELDREAEHRAALGLRRTLLPRRAGDPVTDLAGNDYLGLSRHPDVIEAATGAAYGYGLGATGSRLVRGSTDLHEALERGCAELLGTQAALVYSSGYLANLGAIRALAGPGALIVSDAHNHASIVDGCRLSRAEVLVVPHADLTAVDRALAEGTRDGRRAVVVTESVFSVGGDLAPLPGLHATCRRHGALLLVDEAHGFGVTGPAGAGGVAAAGLAGEPDIVVVATLSKAFGAAGGLVAGPRSLIRHLVDTGRTFIYDTALAPAHVAGALAALGLVRAGDALRAELRERVTMIGTRLPVPGPKLPAGGVVSVPAPDPTAALAWAAACLSGGVAVGCFRPPSTPDGSSRLRLTVNVGVPRSAFEAALSVVARAAPQTAAELTGECVS